jgi:hypothetical protein
MARKCTFTCFACSHDFRVIGDEELLRKCVSVDPKCPHCEGALKLGSAMVERGHTTTELAVGDFWSAIHGFGLPEEVVAGPEAIEAMLLAHMVVEADVKKTTTGRVEIRSLTLNNGVKMHFAASGEGAVIFKSTKEEENGGES